MADQKVKVAKPAAPKPRPVKTTTPKPAPISVPKAHVHGTNCIRCNADITGTTKPICSTCDLALQEMHWNSEQMLFRRTVYIPTVPHDDGPSLNWLISNGYAEHIRKPPRPYLRNFSAPKPTVLTM